MSDFYTEMAQMVVDITKPTSQGGLGTGVVTVKRTTSALQEPDADFDPDIEPTQDTYTFNGATTGVIAEYVDGDMVAADDLMIVAPVFATKDNAIVDFAPLMSDELSIGGKVHRINKIEQLPADGTPSAFLIFVAS